jgi:heme exporter protein C
MMNMKTIFFAAGTLAAVAMFGVLPFLVMGAPIDKELFFNQRIFYYHVPAIFMMFVAVFVSGIASIGYLKNRKAAWDDVAGTAGDLAVLFGAIMMTTGPIWAKVAWGDWWVWEARLTSALLLWMVFIAYALIRRYGGPGSERLAAGVAVFGMVDVPLVYFAVNVWRTRHPSNSVVQTLPPSMRGVFNASILAYALFFTVLFVAYLMIKRAERRLNEAEDLAAELGME